MTKPKRKTPEADLQIAIVQWFNWAYPDHARWLHHSPNGGKRSKSEGARFKRMGTKAGFPDLVLYHALSDSRNAVGMAMELKGSKEDKPKKEQEDWAMQLQRVGFYCYLCWDLDQAITLFISYMHPIKPRVKP